MDDTDVDGQVGDDVQVVLVEYRYQVETLPKFDISVEDLNADLLQRVEKAISDILVASFFPPSSGHVCLTPAGNDATTRTQKSSSVVNTATALARGSQRQLMAGSYNSTAEVVGIAAEPADQVMEGDAGGTLEKVKLTVMAAFINDGVEGIECSHFCFSFCFLAVSCPFPVGDSTTTDMDSPGCFVIDGGLSVVTTGTQNADDISSWVDAMVQAELEEAMNAGALDDVDAAISFIRYITPGTALTNNSSSTGGGLLDTTDTSSVQKGGGDDNTALSSAPVWSWILGGFGFVGLAIVAIIGIAAYKRRNREETDNFDSPTKSMASRGRGSPLKGRGSPLKFRGSPRKGNGAFPVNPIEIVDDNSELDEAEIYQDHDDDGDNIAREVTMSRPMSWRTVPEPPSDENEEYSRLEINATDPNQPVIRPVLDEESETYISTVV